MGRSTAAVGPKHKPLTLSLSALALKVRELRETPQRIFWLLEIRAGRRVTPSSLLFYHLSLWVKE